MTLEKKHNNVIKPGDSTIKNHIDKQNTLVDHVQDYLLTAVIHSNYY